VTLPVGPHKGTIVSHRSKMLGDKLAISIKCDVQREFVEAVVFITDKVALKETETQLADCRDTVSAQQQTIDSVIVACGSLGLSASELPKHIEGLRARLQAAEAERAAAQKERDEERRKAAEHELNWRSVSDKLVDSWAERDNLQADLAAAKAESARAVVEELLDVQDYFGTQAVNARNAAKRPTPEDKRVGNGYDVQARIWDAAIGNIEHRIHKLRAAQPPQPQPATVRQGDEVLRDFMEVNTNPDNNRLFAAVVELCRRALEGQ